MTEAEWLACDDPRLMLRALDGKTNSQRLFQFATFFWHRGARFLEGEENHRGLEALEALANGEAIDERDPQLLGKGGFSIHLKDIGFGVEISKEPESAIEAAISVVEVVAVAEATDAGDQFALVALIATRAGELTAEWREASRGLSAALRQYCPLVLEFFGNPFRPVTFSPEWRTDTAVSLARTMYESREFSAMPILADALQDAGCDNDDVLSHARGPGPHVRGCWILDLILGKE